eukprot:675204-Hanusia_phi.AAC.3
MAARELPGPGCHTRRLAVWGVRPGGAVASRLPAEPHPRSAVSGFQVLCDGSSRNYGGVAGGSQRGPDNGHE